MARLILFSLLFWFLPFSLCAAEVRVLAAASLKGVIAEAAAVFEERNPQQKIVISTASSGTLARQIAAGAPTDLFLSANPRWMSHLVEKGKVQEGTAVDWASNQLVVIGRGKALSSLDELAGLARIAIGSPESAPVGRYARDMLQKAGLYKDLEEGQRLVMAKDVWQALLYAEQGVVDAAILYASDSLLSKKATVVLVPDQHLQPKISYPIALTIKGEKKSAANDFFIFLQSAGGTKILKQYGFTPLLKTEAG